MARSARLRVRARDVRDLELDAVGVREEGGVVTLLVAGLAGVVGRSVEDLGTDGAHRGVYPVDGRRALGVERQMVGTRLVAVVPAVAALGTRRAHLDVEARAARVAHAPAGTLRVRALP